MEHRVARIAFDGRSPEVAGRIFAWAAGAELAHEKRKREPVYRDAAGNEVDQANVIGSFDFAFSGDRTRLSKFVELSVPLHERWDVSLAGRHDDHDDVDSTVSHQVATRFRLNEQLTLRGSWSKTAKPPGIGGAARRSGCHASPGTRSGLRGFATRLSPSTPATRSSWRTGPRASDSGW